MPILNIDSMGNYYETDPDSCDGSGYKGATPVSGCGDVTLGNVYLNAESERIANENMMNYSQKLHDRHQARLGAMREEANQKRMWAIHVQAKKQDDPFYRVNMMKKGLAQAAREEIHNAPIPLSGHGLSANGVFGEMGEMTPEQLTRAAVLTGKRASGIRPVDPQEVRAKALSRAVENTLAIDASNSMLKKDLAKAGLGSSPMKQIRSAPMNIHHPLAIFVVKA